MSMPVENVPIFLKSHVVCACVRCPEMVMAVKYEPMSGVSCGYVCTCVGLGVCGVAAGDQPSRPANRGTMPSVL